MSWTVPGAISIATPPLPQGQHPLGTHLAAAPQPDGHRRTGHLPAAPHSDTGRLTPATYKIGAHPGVSPVTPSLGRIANTPQRPDGGSPASKNAPVTHPGQSSSRPVPMLVQEPARSAISQPMVARRSGITAATRRRGYTAPRDCMIGCPAWASPPRHEAPPLQARQGCATRPRRDGAQSPGNALL